MSSRLQLDMRNRNLGRRHLVNAYEVEADIGVIAGNTVWSMPERLECEVLQKARYKISPVRDWRSTSLECIGVGGGGGGEAIIWDHRLQVCHFACSSVYFSLYFINFLFDSVW